MKKYIYLLWIMAAQTGLAQYDYSAAKGLLFIDGGTFTMGGDGLQNGETNTIPRRVTVSSFHIDAAEVTNREYRAFVDWTLANQPKTNIKTLLPDTLAWLRQVPGEIGQQLSRDYFRLPAFDYHPVVGVNQEQAQLFCAWRTQQLNKNLAKPLPAYRLPTESEWEFAALPIVYENATKAQAPIQATTAKGPKHLDKNIEAERKAAWAHAKQYPTPAYYNHSKYRLPRHVYDGEMNNYGIYNAQSNVREWVKDTYRPNQHNSFNDQSDKQLNKSLAKDLPDDKRCPPTNFPPHAPIQDGSPSKGYAVSAQFFDSEDKQITYADFLKAQKTPSSPFQITRRDSLGHYHIQILSAVEHQTYRQNQQLAYYFDPDLGDFRVVKGRAYSDDTPHTPASRFPQAERQSSALVGFRCAMTHIGRR